MVAMSLKVHRGMSHCACTNGSSARDTYEDLQESRPLRNPAPSGIQPIQALHPHGDLGFLRRVFEPMGLDAS